MPGNVDRLPAHNRSTPAQFAAGFSRVNDWTAEDVVGGFLAEGLFPERLFRLFSVELSALSLADAELRPSRC